MKTFISIAVFITISIINYAQIKSDIIYLSDGTIVKGNILNDTADNVTIKTFHGNIFAFEQEDIREIKNKYKRYINYTSAGILIGSALNERPSPISVLTEHNYQFYNYFAAGGVIGIELLKETIIPLGINTKIYIPLKNRTLFIAGSLGHSFPADKPVNEYELEDAYGGPFASTELGILVPLNSNNSIFFAIGYRYNELSYKYFNYWRGHYDRTYYLKRLSMRFGLALY